MDTLQNLSNFISDKIIFCKLLFAIYVAQDTTKYGKVIIYRISLFKLAI